MSQEGHLTFPLSNGKLSQYIANTRVTYGTINPISKKIENMYSRYMSIDRETLIDKHPEEKIIQIVTPEKNLQDDREIVEFINEKGFYPEPISQFVFKHIDEATGIISHILCDHETDQTAPIIYAQPKFERLLFLPPCVTREIIEINTEEKKLNTETDILRYLNDLADSLGLPLIMCITVGSSMGGHTSTLPLPFLIDGYSIRANRISVVGGGNEGDKRHHYYNVIEDEEDTKTVELRVGENVQGFSMELWTDIPNILSISIISPSGENTSRIPLRVGASAELDFLFERTKVSVDYRILVERSNSELIFFRFAAPAPGIWKIVVEPLSVNDGQFHMWLPLTEFLSGEVFFLESDPYYTLTNPANTDSPVVVSYYDGNSGAVAQASGRGYTRTQRRRPDIAAPGINVLGALPGGRFSTRSGSCAAAAVTAGAVALMLEWLVYVQEVPGVDSYQVKSLLILGAVRPKSMEYPNREWGYGQLNLYNTFETMRQL